MYLADNRKYRFAHFNAGIFFACNINFKFRSHSSQIPPIIFYFIIFAGKWEDGVVEKVLGDPLADYDAKEIIDQLIENGADIIDFPAPGSRHGITVERIRELIEYTHRKGALAMSFLNSNVEAADRDTIREVTLLMKQTGCDVHAIGDGGFGGGTWPENIYQMSVTLKGKAYTWAQMATPRR